MNPQRAAPKAAAYAIPPSPREIERRGETTPFFVGLCSDYAWVLIRFPALSTHAAIRPAAYPTRLPFLGCGVTSLLILLSTSSDPSALRAARVAKPSDSSEINGGVLAGPIPAALARARILASFRLIRGDDFALSFRLRLPAKGSD